MTSRAQKSEQLFRQAELKEEAGDLKGAFDLLTKAARLGDIGAQVNLGNYYSSGIGVQKNFEKAAEWYQTAYRNGERAGANNLAVDLKKQRRVKEAIVWFKRAVALNDGDASVELAKLLKNQPNGLQSAIKYLRRAISMSPSDITDDGRLEAKLLLRRLEKLVNSASVRQKPAAKKSKA
jgi:TPR repeat protein